LATVNRIRGALAAAVTPLRDGGNALDEDAAGPLLAFYAEAGLDGVLVLGTTGEGILLSLSERRTLAARALAERPRGLAIAVHCGAQSTPDTVALAAHAAETGADAVAVIGPPYYALSVDELLDHFAAAAAACAPTPFYLYEFAARTGYAVPVELIERLRDAAPNLAGLKVSDAPLDRFAPYLLEGLDVFVGPEGLIADGLARGAVGAVSGLAAGMPELVRDAVASGTPDATARAAAARDAVQRFPFQSALKALVADRGVPISTDVRRPLRALRGAERESLLRELDGLLAAS
jgi:dihydrodipicolinate synthase/N-acetylneuraminate lyase